ncbi:hypothetical protein GCM10009551_099080 [Nocardiopsis tropica]
MPKSTPAAYPPTSEHTTRMMSAATRCGPRLSGSTSIAPNDANSGIQASTKTVVEMSRVKEFGAAVL